jgi:hypothetical protein
MDTDQSTPDQMERLAAHRKAMEDKAAKWAKLNKKRYQTKKKFGFTGMFAPSLHLSFCLFRRSSSLLCCC